jgi:iron-regulated transporter 1
MIGGVVASRTGLWLFDLAVTQLVQENVDPLELGKVLAACSSGLITGCCQLLCWIAW